MSLLHIYDSSDENIRETAAQRTSTKRLGIATGDDLAPALDKLVTDGEFFSRVLFETHGGPGRIRFGDQRIWASYWRGTTDRSWYRVVTNNARVYFNGCNVAEGNDGWAFLEAASQVFLKPGGGEVFGQTSLGFANPFNGHVIHLWGDTRRIYCDVNGRILERFEQ